MAFGKTRMATVRANGNGAALNGGTIQAAIVERMPQGECGNVDVQARVAPQGGVPAVLVVATCTVTPFWSGAWSPFNVPNFIVNAAFPL